MNFVTVHPWQTDTPSRSEFNGGVLASDAEVFLHNCIFTNVVRSVYDKSGVVELCGHCNARLEDCRFENGCRSNQAILFHQGCNVTVVRCVTEATEEWPWKGEDDEREQHWPLISAEWGEDAQTETKWHHLSIEDSEALSGLAHLERYNVFTVGATVRRLPYKQDDNNYTYRRCTVTCPLKEAEHLFIQCKLMLPQEVIQAHPKGGFLFLGNWIDETCELTEFSREQADPHTNTVYYDGYEEFYARREGYDGFSHDSKHYVHGSPEQKTRGATLFQDAPDAVTAQWTDSLTVSPPAYAEKLSGALPANIGNSVLYQCDDQAVAMTQTVTIASGKTLCIRNAALSVSTGSFAFICEIGASLLLCNCKITVEEGSSLALADGCQSRLALEGCHVAGGEYGAVVRRGASVLLKDTHFRSSRRPLECCEATSAALTDSVIGEDCDNIRLFKTPLFFRNVQVRCATEAKESILRCCESEWRSGVRLVNTAMRMNRCQVERAALVLLAGMVLTEDCTLEDVTLSANESTVGAKQCKYLGTYRASHTASANVGYFDCRWNGTLADLASTEKLRIFDFVLSAGQVRMTADHVLLVNGTARGCEEVVITANHCRLVHSGLDDIQSIHFNALKDTATATLSLCYGNSVASCTAAPSVSVVIQDCGSIQTSGRTH